jgi:type I restriction enzyme R subunit
MRKEIKRVLRRYDYPPDKTEDATDLIIRQAEFICNSKIISE